ncbi:NAD(P)-dependent oxidoreductase [Pseudactinotalea suaedae]|uniref:NAD(P)-dependent oxidoreductase n=1 Tax=Pseudactinotalea suaedae TaxID=1524924 RepID=UPI0012E0FE9D|nr:NAD(P)-binding domain-containing protein [Pseudactinotalea suaedae]
MTTIGFIGPGIMGAPMIANLVGGGHRVRAYGRSEASRTRIEEAGAETAASVTEAAQDADIVITMLPDSPDVTEVVLDDGGLGQTMRAGQVYIDMSTIRPDVAQRIHATLDARDVPALDAPVSGGEPAAVAGELSIMVGGSAETLAHVRPVLEALGSTITHVGGPGAGQLTKAANQLIVAANIQAVAEAIVLLEANGADLTASLEAIAGGLAGSTVLNRKRQAFLEGAYAPGFRIDLHDKDLRIVGATAESSEVALPMTAVVTQLMRAAKANGYGGSDHSALLAMARQLNNRD